jgi:beta-phosphoglucomutase-like phosphatase (HAD superfamily)
MKNLIIFDCDGVLVDSEIITNRMDAEALTNLGYPDYRREHSTFYRDE